MDAGWPLLRDRGHCDRPVSRCARRSHRGACVALGARWSDRYRLVLARSHHRSPVAEARSSRPPHCSSSAGPSLTGRSRSVRAEIDQKAVTPGHRRSAETRANGTEPGGVSPLSSPAHLPPAVPHALFVVPARTGASFRASIRGRMLDLADPGSADWLAPTPDDLFVASMLRILPGLRVASSCPAASTTT
jgi:hypothetical protein